MIIFYRVYDTDALEKQFLITSRKTGFSLEYLYKISTYIHAFQASFQSIALQYDLEHSGQCSDEEKKERQGLIKQHIRDGYLTYAVLGNIVIISCA